MMKAKALGTSIGSYVDGNNIPADSSDCLEVVNPLNGHRLLEITAGSEEEVDLAVGSARAAYNDGRWSQMPPSQRKSIMLNWADLIEENAEKLDALDAEEMGKPVSIDFCNSAAAAEFVRFNAEAIDKLVGDVFNSEHSSLVYQKLVPRGVVAAIVPWNFPAFCVVLKAAPALAAGNTVVLKPSEMSSRSALLIAQLAVEAGLPAGAFNVVLGLGNIVGKALALHHSVDMITFTGSTAIGKQMLQYAGQSNMKQVAAECGGKSPQIVFADGVNLEAAAISIAQLIMTNQGQLCSTGSRLLVHKDVERELLERITTEMDKAVIGDPLLPNVTFGPIASVKQSNRIMEYINNAIADGAELVTGGGRLLEETGGCFIAPTVFRHVDPASALAQEEIFGPVLSVSTFNTVKEAIDLANSTLYGLAAYAWTNNLSTGMQLAEGINSGVSINAAATSSEGAGHAEPIEPYGESGIGVEGGVSGLLTYMYRKTVAFNYPSDC